MKKGIVTLGDQVAASLTNFLTGVIIGRFSSKEELGLYSLGFSIILFIIGIQNSLISIPYTVYSPRFKGARLDHFTGSSLIHQLALCAVAIILLYGASIVLKFIPGPVGLRDVLLVLSVTVVFIMLREFGRRICFARLWMKKALLIDTWVGIIQVSILFWLAHDGMLNAGLAFIASSVACATSVIIWFIGARKIFRFNHGDVRGDLSQNWKMARWMVLSSLAYTAGMHLYPWFIAYFHGAGAAGVFAACAGVVALANPFLLGISNYLGPRTAHAVSLSGVDGLNRIIGKTLVLFLAVMTLFVVAMSITGGYLVKLIYGWQYAGNGMIVLILSLNLLIASLVLPFRFGMIAIERTDMLYRAYLVSLAVTLFAGILLVREYGLLGAGIGLVCSSLSLLVACWLFFSRSAKHVSSIARTDIPEDEWSSELHN